MAFDPNQLGMAIFLLIAAIVNLWFVGTSYQRIIVSPNSNNDKIISSSSYQLLSYAVLTMASFDILWVWLCMIQCWNNTFHQNAFNQNSGDDSFGCKFMGWYSSFSLVGMMGSHCLVAYYLLDHSKGGDNENLASSSFLTTRKGWMTLSTVLLITACLFASMPLMQGDGYALTNGGFCYADFTNETQASVILFLTLAFLALSTVLWAKIGQWAEYWYYYAIFVGTWILWIPAASVGIAKGVEIASPYMLIGAILGHGNAIVNPLLYGKDLFKKQEEGSEKCIEVENEGQIETEFKEAPEIA